MPASNFVPSTYNGKSFRILKTSLYPSKSGASMETTVIIKGTSYKIRVVNYSGETRSGKPVAGILSIIELHRGGMSSYNGYNGNGYGGRY